MDGSRAMYGIAAVERMTGISAATIRAWQERHGLADPVAGPKGQTLYSRDDVERIIEFAARAGEPDPVAPAKTPAPAAEAPAGAHNLLILLAERDPYAADLSEYFLRTEGYQVETVFSAAEALERVEAVHPHVAIVELLMDGGEGMELARQLVATGDCPVIAISPLDISGQPEAETFSAFLRKPLDPLVLVSAVKDLLGTSALVASRRQP